MFTACLAEALAWDEAQFPSPEVAILYCSISHTGFMREGLSPLLGFLQTITPPQGLPYLSA